ncbi:MAG: methionine synthase [Microthrixaceae bacterium]|nr:methionine synthase [Microthrixaceae bacterium]
MGKGERPRLAVTQHSQRPDPRCQWTFDAAVSAKEFLLTIQPSTTESDRHPYLQLLRERVVVFDGAAGTYLQQVGLTADDFGGEALDGCTDLLSVTRPDVIAQMHADYFAAGADVVETNSFGAFGIPLGEYDLQDRTHEINFAAARTARDVADSFSTPDRPRFVAGSMGPGTKFATLGQVSYAALRDLYEEQGIGLLEGGVDLFIIETQFDLLGIKAAMNGVRRAMKRVGREVPIQTQVTIETTGRMLPGTEIAAALGALDPMRPDVIGLNCATGPSEMGEHIRYLSQHSRIPISVLPNAGLPSVVDGKMHYDLGAEDFTAQVTRFVTDFGVRVVGGCCGTTPEYIRQLAEAVAAAEPAPLNPQHQDGATSIYSFQPFGSEEGDNASTAFLMIGERTNANGSKAFREAILAEDWDTTVSIAKAQISDGSHVLDLCVDYVGRDGTIDMDQIAQRFATQSTVPLVLDSTEPEVLESGLQWLGGRAILNSANLEDGDAEGSRMDRVFTMAREYGAAVICLLIDEEGQARDVEWKVRVAHRLHDIAINRYGLEPGDLIFDALTFPLSTGDEDLRNDAAATIEAIRRIHAELPGVYTTLGLSNVSFGLSPASRHVLNSVFLAECIKAGLTSAIAHASKIIPLSRIPDEQRDVCLDLIWDRRGTAGALSNGDPNYDPLHRLLEIFADVQVEAVVKEDRSDWPVERRLSTRIIDGDSEGLTDDLDEAIAGGLAPLAIINDVLLEGMKVVGDLFGKGEMQLPFVLQSAETMKRAVAYLEPMMDSSEAGAGKGRVVLATVKGDVHDIGKNLVDIILTNNGYEVHNLGIKVSIAEMIDKALEVEADAIGMSGLLVKSTLIMRDNLEELNARNLSKIPVMLGGAALTRTYVERDLREVYTGRLFYGKDAFEGLHVMDKLGQIKAGTVVDDAWGVEPGGRALPKREKVEIDPATIPARSPEVAADNPVFAPPFLGSRIVKGLAIDDIAPFINETTIFRNQWQFRPENGETDEQFKERLRPELRARLAQCKAEELLVPQVVYGYFCANSIGDDLVIWSDETRTEELGRFHYPRQQVEPWLCIADFFRPYDDGAGELDYAAFHIVTMGPRISEYCAQLFADNRYNDYLRFHGIGVEMAEALAEYWHKRIRTEWGFVDEDGPTTIGLFRQQYRGGRYSSGYPACPNLEDNALINDLLDGGRIGLEVSEETGWQYHPEQSTSALICHHPRAKYFVAR